MAKKGAPVALQTEVTNDAEWALILERKGLVLVDVYSDWSGPCTAMVSSLRKIKLESGVDILSYAVARNNDITDLERFRGNSEPVWMFIQNGTMVNMMFGAHCPNLSRLLLDEIKRVQQDEAPKFALPVSERGPEEQKRWEISEEQRLAKEKAIAAKENAERQAKYEAMLSQMMFELCEETALLLFPWVFVDEEGYPRDKKNSPPYVELVTDLFEQCFDVIEEVRVQLTEDIIDDMFTESNFELTEDIVFGLTDGKCMVMRLKGRPPHPDWPVKYPVEYPDKSTDCPVREINDVENYLSKIIYDEPPPLIHGAGTLLPPTRTSYEIKEFANRHVYVHEPDPEVEDDVKRTYPAVWVPPQARSKVHVFKTIFPQYMESSHPYEEIPPPLPKCFFKYKSHRIKELSEALSSYAEALERFGVFETDNPPTAKRIASSLESFEKKVKYPTGYEVFVVVVNYVNEETFLGFAGIEPYFESQSEEETLELIDLYFPESAVDELPIELDRSLLDVNEEEEYEDEDEEEEEDDAGYVDDRDLFDSIL
ncbi:uncharacterized protein LOC124410720 [Diprion similis]|uniref:uncharacterized protein LOC124410720 n=1 Tax=Diprion similis TaxID=362088 RepID=UPI001EF94D25|nr:uncharacterized protein LOC124410720 [Diprion similis]